MKTILKCKWAVSLCLATLLMAACSTEETNVPPLAENESSKLISALEIVNQELMNDTAKVSADIELQLTILDSEELQTECKTIARDIINGQGDNNNSTVDKILELFEDVLKQYPEESKDVAFVIGKYTEIIDQSDELTEEEKMVLKSTFATALCSSKYWEDNMQ